MKALFYLFILLIISLGITYSYNEYLLQQDVINAKKSLLSKTTELGKNQ